MIGRFGLDRLLAPVTGKEFLEEHWEHTPLHVSRQDSSYFAELFTAHDVDDLLYGGGHVFTNLAAVEGSAGTERVLRGVPADDRSHRDGRVSLARIRALQAQGGTVLLHSVHRNVPRVGALAREVESALQCPVNVNMYLTPAHAQGFSAHFDDHDVFVVQIGGRKRWRLYPTVRELPLRFETLTRDAEDHQEPSAEYELCAGDTLYLPRGTIHEAFTDSDQPSLHLTIGLEVFRWADVLARAVRDCARDHLPLRRALPPGWVNDPAGTRAASVVPELLRAVADRVEAEAAVRALGGGSWSPCPSCPTGASSTDTTLTTCERRPCWYGVPTRSARWTRATGPPSSAIRATICAAPRASGRRCGSSPRPAVPSGPATFPARSQPRPSWCWLVG